MLIAGPELGDLVAYDLSKKSLNPDKAYGFLIKSKNRIRIPKAEREKLEKLACNNNDASGNNSNNNRLEYMRVQLICSTDFDYAIVVYQNIEIWAAYLYHIYHGRRLGSYVAQVIIIRTNTKEVERLITQTAPAHKSTEDLHEIAVNTYHHLHFGSTSVVFVTDGLKALNVSVYKIRPLFGFHEAINSEGHGHISLICITLPLEDTHVYEPMSSVSSFLVTAWTRHIHACGSWL